MQSVFVFGSWTRRQLYGHLLTVIVQSFATKNALSSNRIEIKQELCCSKSKCRKIVG